MKTKYNYVLSLVILCCILSGVQAQTFDASSMGMGGAYSAVARGVDALAWNPANLALPRIHAVELSFISLNVAVANSSLSLKNYERYFTESGNKGEWTEKDQKDILDLIPSRGLQTTLDANVNAMGLAVLSYGISAEVMGTASGLIPKGVAELYVSGNTLKDQYSLDGADADGFSALKIGFSAAQKIPFKKYFDVFSVGLKLNYYKGISMAEVLESEGAIYTGTGAIYYYGKARGRYANGLEDSLNTKPFAGKGFGMDLGAAGTINQKFTFSLALQNLFASLKWDKGTEEFLFILPADSFRIDDTDKEVETTDTSYAIKSFSTRLPVVMHLGMAYQLKENLLLSLDLEQAFENRLGYSDQAKVAIGSEYRPVGWIPLRAGLSFGGKWGGYSVGLGFGLHAYVFEFDLAYLMQHALWPTYADGASVAMNMKFLF
jgi:hypothetical protein